MLLFATAASAQNPSPDHRPVAHPPPPILLPGASVQATLQPHQSLTLALPVHLGAFNQIRIRQIQGMTQSFLIDPNTTDSQNSLPHFNDGGVGSLQRISFLPSQTGTFYLRVESRERHTPVIFQITRSPQRSPQPRDQIILQAESALTQAEYVRHCAALHPTQQPLDSTHVLALYSHAYHLSVAAADNRLARESLIGKARYQIFRSAQYQQGVQTATRATQIPSSVGDIHQQALAWKTLASAFTLVDRYAAAIHASQRALALYQRTGDLYWQGIVLGNLADTYRDIGDSTRALQAATQALQLAQQLSDDYGIAYTQAVIGEIYQGQGRYQHAIDAFNAALDTANILSYPQVEGEVWTDMGELYARLGSWERAQSAYANALPILQKDGDGINEIEVTGHLGELALHSLHPHQAQQYFRQGLARAHRLNLIREQAFLNAGLARTCLLIPCATDPLQLLSQAQLEARQIHQLAGEAAIQAAIGDVLAQRRQISAAIDAYHQSAALWRQIPNAAQLAMLDADLARLHAQQGQLTPARDEILRALDAMEDNRAHIQSDDLRTSYFTSKRSYYDLAVNILMQLHRAAPHHGYAQQAWTIAERSRARTLLDQLQQQHDEHPSPAAALLQKRSETLELKIHESENQLALLGSSPSDLAHAQLLQQKLHRQLMDEDQWKARIRAATPAYHTLVAIRSITPSQFSHSVLTEKTAILEYWVSDQQSYLWIITRQNLFTFTLPGRNSLDALIQPYQQSLQARDSFLPGEDLQARLTRIQAADQRLPALAQKLTAALLPARLPAQIHQLLIVGDGKILSIPFAALQLPHTQPGSSPYLIAQYNLVSEPSAFTAWALRSKPLSASSRSRIAIFADPVYTRTDARIALSVPHTPHRSSQPVLRSAAFQSLDLLPRLRGSQTEAAAIERIAGASHTSLFLGFDASPHTLEKINWQSYAALHFAAHAIVDREHPELSGIVLSMFHRNGAPADGVLWLQDIYHLRIPVSLVALSGCETADGQSIPGEGINGLARAFLYAGAQSVMGTLWAADDRTSSKLMQSFYSAFLKRNLSAAEALRVAQLRTLRDPLYAQPYFWAGFILEGDWEGRYRASPTNQTRLAAMQLPFPH
ncbi:MAG: CHAT domain-containing protein [Acidobacteriaceae bacterium]